MMINRSKFASSLFDFDDEYFSLIWREAMLRCFLRLGIVVIQKWKKTTEGMKTRNGLNWIGITFEFKSF